jgi:hypothetical protein
MTVHENRGPELPPELRPAPPAASPRGEWERFRNIWPSLRNGPAPIPSVPRSIREFNPYA